MDKGITLICGDAIAEMGKMPSASVDLIVADPPYNLDKDYGKGNDSWQIDEYLEFSEKWIQEACRLLKENGSIYVCMGMRFISHIFTILEKNGLFFNSWITWHYTQGIGKTKGFSPRHDDILFFTKHKSNYTFNLDAVRVPQKYYRSVNNMRGANPGNVWEFSHVHFCNKNRRPHPTQKPEALFERIVLASSNVGDMVLDPFVGSGTTARVCQQTNRMCVGIDANPEYVEMSIQRLAEEFCGFDSIDERMKRLPKDLVSSPFKEEYIKNHIHWFLKNHENQLKSSDFFKEPQLQFDLFS